ncbi:MAG: DUF4474 domain-containing protein [Clostridia bacterium]|nr:DUF4474 domain-containing protein [Clostridia bacterium]MBQ7046330.1 DUF4474 domain-containing protein [Oscillospiraceae bacterium]
MKTKNFFIKMLSLVIALVIVASVAPLSAFAADQDEALADGHALVLTSEHLSVTRRRTIQMTASVTNVETQPKITWSSSDERIATVDENGKVRGIEPGRAIIFATAVVDGETLSGEFAITVVKRNSFLKNFLEKRQVLSYKYSYVDDYYYTNDKAAWQHNFGFGKVYDFFSPYILLEYDYIRIFFTYDDKDWMLQMWKGQYGMVFYGGEIGIYNRPHSDKGVSFWTMFACPEEEDWLKMEMTLWHQKLDGRWNREFTRDYDYYWWCTGFKNGHLRQEEPADELRLTGRITFKDDEMAKLVADGFAECGFKSGISKDGLGLDEIYVDGSDIYFCWQNISEAESTMAIKVGAGFLAALPLLPLLPIILPFVGAFSMLISLVNLIL